MTTKLWRDLVRPAPEGGRFAVRLTPKGGADALEGLDRDDAGGSSSRPASGLRPKRARPTPPS